MVTWWSPGLKQESFTEPLCVSVCVCVCVCILCGCVDDRKELELTGVCPHQLCVRPPRYTCTSVRAAIIDMWPANYWF